MIGINNGYEGLINGEYHPMDERSVGGIFQRGGTILLTCRSKRFMEPAGQRDAIRKMNEAGMDALVVIGGEGSLNGAYALSQKGIKVIGIPGSIDNDVWGTDIAIGTDTAMNTIMEAVDKLRDTASSHQRAFVIETMGRNSGYLAVMSGIVCGAEMVLIPEVPVTWEDVAKTVSDAYQRGKTHAIIINAEGSTIDTNELVQKIDTLDVGFKTRVSILGHIQRGGSPTAYDRLLGITHGRKSRGSARGRQARRDDRTPGQKHRVHSAFGCDQQQAPGEHGVLSHDEGAGEVTIDEKSKKTSGFPKSRVLFLWIKFAYNG